MKTKLGKYLAILTVAVSLTASPSCTSLTPQQEQTITNVVTVAKPIADAAIVAAAAYYGVPPGASMAVIAAGDSLWGAYQQAQAGQPVAQGAVSAPIGNAIAAATANLPQDKKVAAIQAAATMLQSRAATPPKTSFFKTQREADGRWDDGNSIAASPPRFPPFSSVSLRFSASVGRRVG